jgi:Bacterial Ig domain
MNQNHTHEEPHYYRRLLLILLVGLLGMVATVAQAQTGIRYNVRYIGGSKYQVSMTPNVTLLGNDRMVSTAQVTIKTAPGTLTVTNVQSLPQSGLVWNTAVQKVSNPSVPLSSTALPPTPMTSANADYFIFGIPPSAALVPFVAGVEIPLYTFDVVGQCAGELSIWEGNDIFQPNAVNLINVGNNLYAIGFADPFGDPLEAWIGNYDVGQAPCPPPSLVVNSPVNTTATTTPAISGTSTPNSVITINGPGNTVLCSTTANSAGAYSCPVTVPTGPNTLTAVACSPSSCTSCTVTACTSVPFTFTATTPPVIPPASLTVAPPAPGGATQLVSGSATPGSVVAITDPTGATLCSTTVGASGTFACPVTVTATGVTPLTVAACNVTGCTSAPINITNVAPFATTPTPTTLSTPMGTSATLNASTVINPTGGTGPYTYSVSNPPTNGTATINPTTGMLTYTPSPGYVGPDSVTVQVCDSSSPTPQCVTQTIPINVLPISSNCVLPVSTLIR